MRLLLLPMSDQLLNSLDLDVALESERLDHRASLRQQVRLDQPPVRVARVPLLSDRQGHQRLELLGRLVLGWQFLDHVLLDELFVSLLRVQLDALQLLILPFFFKLSDLGLTSLFSFVSLGLQLALVDTGTGPVAPTLLDIWPLNFLVQLFFDFTIFFSLEFLNSCFSVGNKDVLQNFVLLTDTCRFFDDVLFFGVKARQVCRSEVN